MSNKTLYIAYGSNINLQQMQYRCPTAKQFAAGMLTNYELEFRNVATIVPKADAKVPILLWELEPSDERSLDRYEGFPRLYRKEYFSFDYGGETKTAMAYIMNSGQIHEPSQQYFDGIMQGYLSSGLDTSYLTEARNRAIEHDLQTAQAFDLKGGW